MKTLRILAFGAVLTLAASGAWAGTCTCSSTTLALAGGYSVFGGAWQPSAQFGITCNGNATYDVTISTGSSGNYSARTLQQGGTGGGVLNYNIYTDAARTTVWGGTTRRTYDTTSGQSTFPDPLYFDLPANQDVPYSGLAYTDTLNVTLVPAPGTGGPTRSCTATISTTVNAECQAPNASLSFGNYDPASANVSTALDKTSALLYQCTKGVTATVSLDYGQNSGGTTTRKMLGPGGLTLNYEIYRDSSRLSIWNNLNTLGGSSGSKSDYLGGPTGLAVYGRVPAGQTNVVAGSYNDTITATINY